MKHFLALLASLGMPVYRFFSVFEAGKPDPQTEGGAGKPVVSPPPGAKDAKGEKVNEDEDAEEEVEGEEADATEADAEEGEEPKGETEAEDEEDAEGEDKEDGGDDEDEIQEEDDEDDAAAATLEAINATLAASAAREPDFTANGVTLDLDRLKLSPEKRVALKKKLAAEDAEEGVKRDADAVLDAMEESAREIALDLLSQYHNRVTGPVNKAVHYIDREQVNGRRYAALKTKLGPKLTEAVETKMKDIYEGLVTKYGHARADTVDFESIYRAVPRKIRKAASGAKGGKKERDEGPEEREARRERQAALAAGTAPRGGLARFKGGSRRRVTIDDESRREVAKAIERDSNFWK